MREQDRRRVDVGCAAARLRWPHDHESTSAIMMARTKFLNTRGLSMTVASARLHGTSGPRRGRVPHRTMRVEARGPLPAFEPDPAQWRFFGEYGRGEGN